MTTRIYEGTPEEYEGLRIPPGGRRGLAVTREERLHSIDETLGCFYAGQRVRVTIQPLEPAQPPEPEPCPTTSRSP